MKADDAITREYALRMLRLTDAPRLMSIRAATIVVEAAMFGNGCIEGEVRATIEKAKEKSPTP